MVSAMAYKDFFCFCRATAELVFDAMPGAGPQRAVPPAAGGHPRRSRGHGKQVCIMLCVHFVVVAHMVLNCKAKAEITSY